MAFAGALAVECGYSVPSVPERSAQPMDRRSFWSSDRGELRNVARRYGGMKDYHINIFYSDETRAHCGHSRSGEAPPSGTQEA
jgi:hypothetical protein